MASSTMQAASGARLSAPTTVRRTHAVSLWAAFGSLWLFYAIVVKPWRRDGRLSAGGITGMPGYMSAREIIRSTQR